ncbi:unnamed protein product [Ranitomeya imitator]|uniref:Uncharacterized protein n=1 Tax=Ranitomeya imitator TaxID=111125 RepID=A0ABN9KUM6_9NEOB|nr:unnamed protein product [Ranitomeya imitator]
MNAYADPRHMDGGRRCGQFCSGSWGQDAEDLVLAEWKAKYSAVSPTRHCADGWHLVVRTDMSAYVDTQN